MAWSNQQQAITRISIFIDLFLWRDVGSPGDNELNEKLHKYFEDDQSSWQYDHFKIRFFMCMIWFIHLMLHNL